jgi:hypothetical protein
MAHQVQRDGHLDDVTGEIAAGGRPTLEKDTHLVADSCADLTVSPAKKVVRLSRLRQLTVWWLLIKDRASAGQIFNSA